MRAGRSRSCGAPYEPVAQMTAKSFPVMHFDAVIVGAGGAGMRASLQLAEAGLSVAVLSKVFPTRSHTVAAQGGIGASLGNMSEDTWLWHMYDTIKGSDWLGDQDAIEYMCKTAADVVYELEHFGMPFDRNDDGTLYQRPFGGHSANFGQKPIQRACAVADRTGHALLHTLYQRNVRARTQFLVEWMALDLIRDADGDVVGVTALEMETGEAMILQAKATILATGGAGRIFAASTNAFINTGDGLGMVARAGLPLEDMEMWQFHPTGVAGAGILITEAVRGEGGILLNANGERFMERLPSIREISIKFGNADPIKEPIPVVPTIHYMMGGIPTNVHGQVVAPKDGNPNSIVPGLFAVGECACVSVHGANRLGTNSLLDLIVFGRATGNFIVGENLKAAPHKPLPADAAEASRARLARIDTATSGESVPAVADTLRKTLQAHCGVFRNQDLLSEGVTKVMALEQRVMRTSINDHSKTFNTARVEALELDNLIEVAKATVVSAEARRESRGAQARSDYPNRDDVNWLKHTMWYREGNRLDYKPVNMKPLSVDAFPPKTRTY